MKNMQELWLGEEGVGISAKQFLQMKFSKIVFKKQNPLCNERLINTCTTQKSLIRSREKKKQLLMM